MSKIFLGGTCANSTWRDELIPHLKRPYFNPVVNNWTPECFDEENRQKDDECDVHLYVLTSEMKGVYSPVEAMDSAHSGKWTICILINDNTKVGWPALGLKAALNLTKLRGAYYAEVPNVEGLIGIVKELKL